jgi:DNA polymerase-3 subunit gamma/tau
MLAVAAPNEPHRIKCQQHQADVEAALLKVVGAPVKLLLSVDGVAAHDESDSGSGGGGNVVPLKRAPAPPPDEDVDLDGLVDAPPEAVVSPVDRLAQAFPGSQIIDE